MSDSQDQDRKQSLQGGLPDSRLNLWLSLTSLVFSIFALVLLARQGDHQTLPSQTSYGLQSSPDDSIQGNPADPLYDGKWGYDRWEGDFVDDKPHGIGQAYVRAERDDEHGRWVGDTAVKGPLLEYVEGKPVNWPGTP